MNKKLKRFICLTIGLCVILTVAYAGITYIPCENGEHTFVVTDEDDWCSLTDNGRAIECE